MTIREELLFDFAVNMPRVLVTGETTVVDNVKKTAGYDRSAGGGIQRQALHVHFGAWICRDEAEGRAYAHSR